MPDRISDHGFTTLSVKTKKTPGSSSGPAPGPGKVDTKTVMEMRFDRAHSDDEEMLELVKELKARTDQYVSDKDAVVKELKSVGSANGGGSSVLKEYPAPIVGAVTGLILAGLTAAGVNTEVINVDQVGQVVSILLAAGLPTVGGLLVRKINT